MITTRFPKHLFALYLALLLVSLASAPAQGSPNAYTGAEKCAVCHKGIYEAYQRSGHPYKLQKVTSGPPTYPPGTSPGVLLPPEGMSWRDISYVIGGYGWKARFMDKQGYILTGPENRQYNLANPDLDIEAHWTGYDADKTPRKPYTCGNCHATGWKETGKDGPHQDGLPGIYGTWALPGVTCESCHGPGAAHAASPGTVKLNVEPNCGSCHVRGDATRIDASGGLVRHHEQYEDLLASPHKALTCTSCHEPHQGTRYGLGGYKGQAKTCNLCHQKQAKAMIAAQPHRECIDCHMPYAGKSAVSKTIAHNGGTVPVGDISSHIVRISVDPAWRMFTDDGSFVRTDDSGKAYLSVDYTCLTCHTGKDKAWAAKNAKRIHGK